ncbi:MAG: hypothetical protein Q9217_005234 [Psora testacea]
MPSALFQDLVLGGSKQVIPAFLYGTAWKNENTADLVYQALCSGFRGIDTAAQPKHYREDLVGDGIRRALSEGKVKRDELFIQTKFTSLQGQDPTNLPYDSKLSTADQVHASLSSSFRNLRSEPGDSSSEFTVIDSLVLHSPLPTINETLKAWQAFEGYVPQKIKHLGISNVTLPVLQRIVDSAKVKPAIIQNRFYHHTEFDHQIRSYCKERSIIYQAFWTLTANPAFIRSEFVTRLSREIGLSHAQTWYCVILGLDNTVILNGTTNPKHVREDLDALEKARKWAVAHPDAWRLCLRNFTNLIAAR